MIQTKADLEAALDILSRARHGKHAVQCDEEVARLCEWYLGRGVFSECGSLAELLAGVFPVPPTDVVLFLEHRRHEHEAKANRPMKASTVKAIASKLGRAHSERRLESPTTQANVRDYLRLVRDEAPRPEPSATIRLRNVHNAMARQRPGRESKLRARDSAIAAVLEDPGVSYRALAALTWRDVEINDRSQARIRHGSRTIALTASASEVLADWKPEHVVDDAPVFASVSGDAMGPSALSKAVKRHRQPDADNRAGETGTRGAGLEAVEVMERALVLFLFIGGSRSGTARTLEWRDVLPRGDTMDVDFRTGKTFRGGVSEQRTTYAQDRDDLCAVAAMQTWRDVAVETFGFLPTYVFVRSDGTNLYPEMQIGIGFAAKVLRRWFGDVVKRPHPHALRSGFKTDARVISADSGAIDHHIGHKPTIGDAYVAASAFNEELNPTIGFVSKVMERHPQDFDVQNWERDP